MIELAGIVILGIVAQWVAWRLKLPAILPLLVLGIFCGPFGLGFVHPDALGDALEAGKLATRRAYGVALKVAGDLLPQVVALDGDVIRFDMGSSKLYGLGQGFNSPMNRRGGVYDNELCYCLRLLM